MKTIVLFEGEGAASQYAKISEAYMQHKQLVIDESFLLKLRDLINEDCSNELQEKIDELKSDLEEKESEYEKLECEMDEVVDERNELEEENDRLRDEIDELREQLSEKDEW